MGDIYSQYPSASWRVGEGGEAIIFPVLGITEAGGNRLVTQERPYRDGAKLDDTGSKARQWSFTAIFNNTITEGAQSGVPLYPQTLRRLLRSFDIHETGTLTLPTVGIVRARAETYSRKETPEEDDQATLELTFVEDNEDALDRAQLNPPAVVATIVKLAEQTTFTVQKNGVWNDDLASLEERASEIEGLLLAPGRSVADVRAVAKAHRNSIRRVTDAATTAGSPIFGDAFAGRIDDPRSSDTHRRLRIMMDREAAAEEERASSRPRTMAFVVDVEVTSLFEVAARLNQDAEELLELNSARVDDPFYLSRGEVIRVFESAPR